jgi:hypothetical protein
MRGSIPPAGQARMSRACSAAFRRGGPCAAAVAATVAVLLTLDPAGSYPRLGQGPGITLDEVFNVEMGVYQWRALRDHGWRLWASPLREQVFDHPGYNPDHPPLGRIGLGVAHDLALTLLPPADRPGPTVTACARVGSAIAFGMTVFLVGACAARWYGTAAGLCAALALALMPRVFAHAHLAALETWMNLTFTATLLHVAGRWGGARVTWGSACAAGLFLGLALLTKIQAVFLPVPIALWALWRWRLRAIVPLLVFGVVGLSVFFLAWPWLWLDPVHHLSGYFTRATDRPTLYCYYLGTRYADVDVPWHYPFVMFAVTIPIGLHLLGLWGSVSRLNDLRSDPFRRDPQPNASCRAGPDARASLLIASIAFVLAFFALPGTRVYDGERLFLVVYPLWAVLIGRGAQSLLDRAALHAPSPGASEGVRSLRRLRAGVAPTALGLFLAAQAWGLVSLHPCQLSYYNLAVGGLRGANRLGFEATYWGDSFTRSFLRELAAHTPRGAIVDVAPVLHPAQLDDLLLQAPMLREHALQLRAYDDPHRDAVNYVIVFRRHADPWTSLEPAPAGSTLLAEVRREGVQLAALFALTHGDGHAPAR